MGCCQSTPTIKDVAKETELKLKHQKRDPIDDGCVTPRIGYVVKSRRKDNTKVFINITYHEYIKGTFILPLTESVDKNLQKCLVYSILVANTLYLECLKDKNARDKVSCCTS